MLKARQKQTKPQSYYERKSHALLYGEDK